MEVRWPVRMAPRYIFGMRRRVNCSPRSKVCGLCGVFTRWAHVGQCRGSRLLGAFLGPSRLISAGSRPPRPRPRGGGSRAICKAGLQAYCNQGDQAMNRVRECIGSSSGLAPMRQGLGWGVSLLAGFVMLLGINNADADRIYCGDISWIQCFDCSSNSEHPICARRMRIQRSRRRNTSTAPMPWTRTATSI